MLIIYTKRSKLRNRRKPRSPSPLDAERARIHRLPAIRLLSDRFAMPLATAVLIAETFGMHTGADR